MHKLHSPRTLIVIVIKIEDAFCVIESIEIIYDTLFLKSLNIVVEFLQFLRHML